MTHKKNDITIILKQLRDLVFRLREDPVTYGEVKNDLINLVSDDPIEFGFHAGREYAANSLEELIHEFWGIVQIATTKELVQ